MHLTIAELVVVLASAVLVLARWLPPAARRRTAAGAAAVAIAGAAGTLPGTRWQILLVLGADLLVGAAAAGVWLLDRRAGRSGRRTRWWLALPGSLLCAALVVGGTVAAWALPVPSFPRLSGPSAVGTTVLQWTDPARDEPATPDPADRRTVVVQLWYPAGKVAREAPRAQYLGRTRREADTVAAAVAGYLGAPGLLFDGPTRSRSHAVPGAAPAAGRFPVVLFSPGLGGVRTQNTAWAEDLASRGYLVAGVDHPYDSAAVVLADGRTVGTRIAAGGDPDEDDRRRISWATVRAADLSFVLTQLGRLDSGAAAGTFTGRLDTGHAAVTGHSLGGAAAMRAAARDQRFLAVINLDGGVTSDQLPLRQPVLVLTHQVRDQADAGYVARVTRVLDGGRGPGYRLSVPGSAHLSFTDAPLYLPPVPALVGSLGRSESVRMTTATSAAFLDATLSGHATGLPATLAEYGDLSVRGSAAAR
ncbi:alpha/beta hydrolase family protein [Actinoplanes siamensis]|uniref:alpha/beta hydrolase family protein n=1 Tax=Actinoplanes siamensis TaxID=1223317 RepID=UPI001EF173C0|nr:hypothetical protein [Actinoplanes siamensis]